MASKTVFINGLPAVGVGDKVIEAAGGPTGIQMGCNNVFIGDGGGGGGGGGGGDAGVTSSKNLDSSNRGKGGDGITSEKETKTEEAETTSSSRQAKKPTKTVKVQLHDSRYQACADTEYCLNLVSGESFQGKTDSAGCLVCEVPIQVESGSITYVPGPEGTPPCSINVDLRDLPEDSEERYLAALKHLGFSSKGHGQTDWLHLQTWADLGMTDRFDDKTKAFLKNILSGGDKVVGERLGNDLPSQTD